MSNKIVTINGKSGEYTGYSIIEGEIIHSFSMYDGSVIRCSYLNSGILLEELNIDPFEAPEELGGKHAYGCPRP